MAMATGINPTMNMPGPQSLCVNKPNQIFSSNPNLQIPNHTKKISNHRVSAAITFPLEEFIKFDSQSKRDVGVSEKIDSWMQDSVSDIVKNLKQAPLLVHVYSENNRKVEINTKKALLDEWPVLRSDSETKTPDGLIFVGELGSEGNVDDKDSEEGGVARAWGVVVQGKGVECAPVCYMLKTNRVCAGIGLGCCTHFCLMKVNNFRDSVFEQFRDSWLLQ